MTAEALTLVVAITIPIATLAAVVGLIRGFTELERSRDELIDLRSQRWVSSADIEHSTFQREAQDRQPLEEEAHP